MNKENQNNETVAAKKEQQKLSYEQLHGVANDLYHQNVELNKRLQQADAIIRNFNRLDYLFKVLEFASVIKDADFINDCVDEIKDAIAIRKEDKEETADKN